MPTYKYECDWCGGKALISGSLEFNKGFYCSREQLKWGEGSLGTRCECDGGSCPEASPLVFNPWNTCCHCGGYMEFVEVLAIPSWILRVALLLEDIALTVKMEGIMGTFLQVLTHPWECLTSLAHYLRTVELCIWAPPPVTFLRGTGDSKYAYWE